MVRIWIVFSVILVLYALLVARLFYWQVIRSSALRLEAASQYYLTFTLPAQRGSILASDGKPLVLNQSAYLAFAEPRKVSNISSFAQSVSSVLELDAKEVQASLSESGRVWVPLAHKVEAARMRALKDLKLTGLGFEKEPKRMYPESSMAAHLVGFVGSDENGKDKGYFGIEGYYDRELGGKDGMLQLEKDVRGQPMLVGETRRIEPEDARSLVLWLDRTVQRSVERRLSEGVAKYGAKEGSVVVMDPKTGGILAMGATPSYDPGSFGEFPKEVYKNPLVAGTYEPGSTFKVFVMAVGIDRNAVTPTTMAEESGPVRLGEYFIRTWDDKYRGTISMTDVLVHSSNVGMVFVQKKIGKEGMLKVMHGFGFGEPTGIDLQEEESAGVRDDDEWKEIDLATASFGQGIAVTPIQMVRAVAAIANGGELVQPRVVKEIRDGSGRVVSIKQKRSGSVISPASARIMTEMMIAAVDRGEAKWAKPKGYRIAGKTGTAQIPVAGHYDSEKTIASFVGFAPADDPKFVMLVTLREPTSSPWGSETAAPLFFTIAKDLFSYYGIAPE
ncbi:penicillin-binding protein 2 [Candidatus Gottesmanbacteria bacterium]|nr:penicillin-binding protein 2 [Candidatus Gottesmanbacteria bacterium]